MLFFVVAIFSTLLETHAEVHVLTSDNYDEYMKNGHLFIKYYSPTCPHCREVAPTFQTLSEDFSKYADRITFAEIDCTKDGSICDKADVRGYPTFYYYSTSDKKDRVEYNGDRSLEDFSKFVAEKINVYYRPKPKLLKEVTPDNWNDTVMDLNKNVLVAFTAPWCGHCKHLKPQMEMAAQSFKPEENVSFVFIDAEKYMDFCSPYEVRGYPTIKFFPAASPEDEKFAEEERKKAEAKAEEVKKRTERKEYLLSLKEAASAAAALLEPKTETNATEANETEGNATETESVETPELNATAIEAAEQAKAAWTDDLKEELKKIEMDELVEENTPETPKKGVNPVEPFTGSRSGAGIVDFINKRCGTHRALGGGIDPFAGLERELAEPLVRYVHAVTGTPLPKEDDDTKKEETPAADEKKEEAAPTEEKKEEATEEKKDEAAPAEEKKEETKPEEERVPPPPVDEARAVVDQLLSHVPSAYVVSQFKRYMELLESKGLSYLDSERERVARILESAHFTDQKKLEFTVRKNVLSLFMTI